MPTFSSLVALTEECGSSFPTNPIHLGNEATLLQLFCYFIETSIETLDLCERKKTCEGSQGKEGCQLGVRDNLARKNILEFRSLNLTGVQLARD